MLIKTQLFISRKNPLVIVSHNCLILNFSKHKKIKKNSKQVLVNKEDRQQLPHCILAT